MPTQTFFKLPKDKQRRILEAALEEFSKHDYNQASVSRIVAEAGIAKGSIYQYFQDKKDLYLYVLNYGMEQKFAFLRQRMGFFPYLRWLMEVNFEFELSQPQLSRFLRQASMGDPPFQDQSLEETRAKSLQYIWQLVRQGCAQGDLEVNTRLGAFMIHTVLSNLGDFVLERMDCDPLEMSSETVANLDRAPAQKIFDELVAVLQYGMAPQQPSPQGIHPQQPMSFPTEATTDPLDSTLEDPEPDLESEAFRPNDP